MKKREIIKKIVSMLMIFALVVPIASQAYAAHPTRGVEVNADHSKLDQAVQEAKASGVDVPQEQTQDKGTASSNSEADAKLAEVKADYENQIQKIKAAKLKMDDYIAKKKEYDKLNRNLRGIRNMRRLPQLMIVVDPNEEIIAVKEAKK